MNYLPTFSDENHKKYRAILDSDIIHVRRPDGRDIDCILHVNPQLKQKALAMVYNPTNRQISKQLKLPLYYSGLTDKALIREQQKPPQEYSLDREYMVNIAIDMLPNSYSWFVIEESPQLKIKKLQHFYSSSFSRYLFFISNAINTSPCRT
ncbi:MAG: hypothetical protein JXD22_09135 [Sedimentisphaerales bacterium]|nr:hypothetical protein [Sedimentisphaerales bacterium]